MGESLLNPFRTESKRTYADHEREKRLVMASSEDFTDGVCGIGQARTIASVVSTGNSPRRYKVELCGWKPSRQSMPGGCGFCTSS